VLIIALWLAGTATAPVSYSRQIAPLLAMHCNGCHGDAGGLGTRSYRELMLGGNLGKVVVPGDPERSLIIHFLEGRRGENHRMPKDSTPLTPAQVALVRLWIQQGATEDHLATRVWRRALPAVPINMTATTRIECRVNVPAYLVVTMRRPGPKREVLWEDAASVKKPKQRGDVGEPGQLIHWDVRAGYGWPKRVHLELEVRYAESPPADIHFSARRGS
jgi:hypothetical protein